MSDLQEQKNPDNKAFEGQLEQFRNEHRKLSLLLNIARNITTELDLTKLLMLIMDEVRSVLLCDRCTIFLLDENRNELFSRVAHGEREIRFPAGLGIAGHVIETGEILSIKNAYRNKYFNQEIDKKTGYTTRTILAVPLRNQRGKIIGVFQALNKFKGTFTDEDSELLDAISAIAATQIENAQLYEAQKRIFDSFIETLASTIDARDPLTSGHSERITFYVEEMADILDLTIDDRAILRTAALLHDYGKIAVRESVLCKEGKLTDEEYHHIQRHASYTKRILEKINFTDELREVPAIAASHHEKVDGTGYPSGLANDDIPWLGKILAVADVFDALTSKRHYRDRMRFDKVIDILLHDTGKHFEKAVVFAFLQITMDRITIVLEKDSQALIDQKDIRELSNYTVEHFYHLLKENAGDEKHKHAIDTFHKYYDRDYLRSV